MKTLNDAIADELEKQPGQASMPTVTGGSDGAQLLIDETIERMPTIDAPAPAPQAGDKYQSPPIIDPATGKPMLNSRGKPKRRGGRPSKAELAQLNQPIVATVKAPIASEIPPDVQAVISQASAAAATITTQAPPIAPTPGEVISVQARRVEAEGMAGMGVMVIGLVITRITPDMPLQPAEQKLLTEKGADWLVTMNLDCSPLTQLLIAVGSVIGPRLVMKSPKIQQLLGMAPAPVKPTPTKGDVQAGEQVASGVAGHVAPVVQQRGGDLDVNNLAW